MAEFACSQIGRVGLKIRHLALEALARRGQSVLKVCVALERRGLKPASETRSRHRRGPDLPTRLRSLRRTNRTPRAIAARAGRRWARRPNCFGCRAAAAAPCQPDIGVLALERRGLQVAVLALDGIGLNVRGLNQARSVAHFCRLDMAEFACG
eukprot:scaffold6179_cov119-Isochrysis_galbana.AAC.4